MFAFLISISPILIFIPDLVKSGNFVLKTFQIQSEFLSFIFTLILICLRLVLSKPIISIWYQNVVLIITLLLTGISIIGICITSITNPNFIYASTYIRIEILCYMSCAAISAWIIQRNNNFFFKNYKKIIVISPIIFLSYCTILFFLPYEIFNDVVREDSLIEYSQFFVLLIGGLTCFYLYLKNKIYSPYKIVFIFFGLALLFVAGDEISWGQRIFNIQTPESVSNINSQNETTLHNLNTIHSYVSIGYMIIGIWGSIFAYITHKLKLFSKNVRYLFFPDDYFFTFFFIPFLFNFYTYTNDHAIGRFTEPVELILYSGIALWLITLTHRKNRLIFFSV